METTVVTFAFNNWLSMHRKYARGRDRRRKRYKINTLINHRWSPVEEIE